MFNLSKHRHTKQQHNNTTHSRYLYSSHKKLGAFRLVLQRRSGTNCLQCGRNCHTLQRQRGASRERKNCDSYIRAPIQPLRFTVSSFCVCDVCSSASRPRPWQFSNTSELLHEGYPWAGFGVSCNASSHLHYFRGLPFNSLRAWLRARAWCLRHQENWIVFLSRPSGVFASEF